MKKEHSDELDPLIAAPQHYKLLFENEFVRVIDANIHAGEITNVHTHCYPASLYFIALKKTEQEREQNIQYALIALGIIIFISIFLLLSRSIIVNEKWIEFLGVLGLLIVFEFTNLLFTLISQHLQMIRRYLC